MPLTTHENLPNVTIRNIVLENDDNSSTKTNIVVDVVVKYGEQPDWIKDDFLLKHLSLMVIKSSNSRFNSDVSKGNIVINASTIALYPKDQGDITVKQIPLISKKDMLMEENTGECLMTLKFSHTEDSQFVDLFAMTVINMSDISYAYGANFKKASMKSYQGPLVSESIFRDGQVVTTSNIMRLPDGTLYYGPYHLHTSGYMVGSKHSSTSHPSLTAEVVPNIKLKDNRRTKHSSNNPGPSNKINSAIFTSLETTVSSYKMLTGMFSININSIVLTKTKYGNLFFNLNQEMYARLINQMKIKKIKIYKRKVQQSNATKKINKFLSRELLVESHDSDFGAFTNRVRVQSLDSMSSPSEEYLESQNFNETIVPIHLGSNFRKKSYIKEENVQMATEDLARYIRTFSFVDPEAYNNRQTKCVYEVDISFSDSSISLLQEIIDEITTVMIELKNYISMASSPRYYDYRGKKLSESAASQISNLYTISEFPWIKSVVTYVKYYSILKDISPTEQEQMRDRYHNFLSPKSFNIHSARSFLQKYNDFLSSFKKYFRSTYKGLDNLTNGKTQKIYQNKNFSDIELNNTFSEIMDFKKIGSGHEYLIYDTQNMQNYGLESIIRMSKGEFYERIKLESTRYPGKKETSENYVSFLSPLSYVMDGEVISLDRGSPIVYKRMFNAIQQDPEIPTTPPYQGVVNHTIGSLNPATMMENIFSGDINYVKAADYLGPRYGSLDTTETLVDFPTDSYADLYSNYLLSIQNPIVGFGENELVSNTNQEATMQEKYYHETKYEILQSPENMNLFTMLFFCVQIVEYRQKVSRHSSMKSSPWTRLTTSAFNTLKGDVVCRLRPFSSVFMPQANIDVFNAYNSLFVISFPSEAEITQPDPSQVLILSEREGQTEDLDYMTSNPILQPQNRAGINSDFNYTPPSSDMAPSPLGGPDAPPGYSEPQSIAETMGAPSPTSAQVATPSQPSQMGTTGGLGGGGYGY